MPTLINPSDQTITQYNVQTGGANNLLNNVAPTATVGVPLISQNASTQPVFGTALVAGGGTGNTTFTAYSLITAGTSATGAFQNVVGLGATGTILQSAGAGALPAWTTATYPATTTINQVLYSSAANVVGGITAANNGVLISSATGVPSWLAAGTTGQVLTATTGSPATWASAGSSSITLTGDTGGGLTGSSFTFTGITQILSGGFAGAGSTLTLNFTDASSNTFLGANAGKTGYSGSYNTGAGASALTAISSGGLNSAFGTAALGHLTTGSDNCGFGYSALDGGGTFTGSYNCGFGVNAGLGYATSESSNICIGYNTQGTTGESNVLNIGNATGTGNGNLNKAVICGIDGKTSASGVAVLINASNVLGTTTSSIRFKEDIHDMADKSSAIYNLRPVNFRYKISYPHVSEEDSKLIQWGLIAEEVLEVMPDLVSYNKDGEVESVRYLNFIPILINELQKSVKRIEELEKRLNDTATNQ